MKVVFAGGGTGGHLYPSIAMAEVLSAKKVDFLFIVSNRGIESKVLKKLGYSYHEQNVSAFQGKGILDKGKAICRVVASSLKVFKLIHKDDIVILTGGYVAAPAAIVAKLKGAKLYLHEQNSIMGLVNRTFAKLCKKVFLSYPDGEKEKNGYIVTGNPVRKAFIQIQQNVGKPKTLLILGGSQGSRTINNLVVDSIDEIMAQGFEVIHQTGEGLFKETNHAYGRAMQKYSGKLTIKPYIESVAATISKADIVIARSGSGAVFELMAAKVPAIFIPYKYASDNHQYYNALSAIKHGGALMLNEDDATPEKLVDLIKEMKTNIAKYRDSLRQQEIKDSATVILKEVGIE